MLTTTMETGAVLFENQQCQFTLWGPELEAVEVQLLAPRQASYSLQRSPLGYWSATVDDIPEGTQYVYRVNYSEERPDPASRYQPEGVHGPSTVVNPRRFQWQDASWKNLPLQDYVIYELHVGTFTPAGTFEAIIPHLRDLQALGITAIELMPVAQFPGSRNWGYDGVYPYAVQNSYGGPDGLKALVDTCHQLGLAVILDVVYNHFGPEGNYTEVFAPFTTLRYKTPWGGAINFDEAWCDGVRRFYIDNALYWLRDYHFDALRLDAIHAIFDFGAKHFLAELAEATRGLETWLDKPLYLIAESDLNDSRIIRSPQVGGYGIDAQWSDDFHHALHTLLTGEDLGYYQDFGTCEALAIALRDRFVYSGNFSAFRCRRHGNQASDLPSTQFVVCAQNHDQVGNRMLGERLTQLVSYEALKLAAGVLLTSPYIPLLFMGEEYGEEAPFLYFIDHGDPALVDAVRAGRKAEFREFHAQGEPLPAHELATFKRSTLNWDLRHTLHP
jgi:maltooligosyltrehalose trehalohydrolase